MGGHDYCPVCPFSTTTSKAGVIRTDSLRRHIQTMHSLDTVNVSFVDAGGFSMEKCGDSTFIKWRMFRNTKQYGDAFCLLCGSWIDVSQVHYTNKTTYAAAHVCKTVRTRLPRQPRAAAGKLQPRQGDLYKLLKKLGGDDYVAMDDDGNVKTEQTLANLLKAANHKPDAGGSVLGALKKYNKLLAPLKIDERVKEKEVFNAGNVEDDELPDPVDEIGDILVPLLCDAVEYSKTATVRQQQHQIIEDLRAKVEYLEDRCDMLTRNLDESAEEYQIRLQAVVDFQKKDETPDVITHVAEEPLAEISVVPAPRVTGVAAYHLPYGGF